VPHRKLLGFIGDAAFWRSLAPQLTIGGSRVGLTARELESDESARVKERLRTDGYFQIDRVFEPSEMTRIEAGLLALTRSGWPALFVFLFDEPWLAYARLDGVLRDLLGLGYRALAACWAWCLERSDDDSGWTPHRDRNFRTVQESGDPDIITIWVAVTEATPDNGCIYVVPATRDPNYSGDLVQCNARTLQDVRALPARAGSILGWNHQLLHWGGHASVEALQPRMSLSAEFQRGEVALLDAALQDAVPSFADRLALVGKQLIRYQHMQPPSAQLLDIARHLVDGGR
jgi:hypothetical protein